MLAAQSARIFLSLLYPVPPSYIIYNIHARRAPTGDDGVWGWGRVERARVCVRAQLEPTMPQFVYTLVRTMRGFVGGSDVGLAAMCVFSQQCARTRASVDDGKLAQKTSNGGEECGVCKLK